MNQEFGNAEYWFRISSDLKIKQDCAGSLLAKAQLPIFFPAGKLQQLFQTPWTASNQAVPSEQQKWLLAVMVFACRKEWKQHITGLRPLILIWLGTQMPLTLSRYHPSELCQSPPADSAGMKPYHCHHVKIRWITSQLQSIGTAVGSLFADRCHGCTYIYIYIEDYWSLCPHDYRHAPAF